MTSFEEIVRAADDKKVPDPFVNTKKIILEICCVKEKPFELILKRTKLTGNSKRSGGM